MTTLILNQNEIRGLLPMETCMGLVADVFDPIRILKLPGPLAIGHNRYSTAGKSELVNAQPCMINYSEGSLALAHNGNLVNAQTIRKELGSKGAIFQSTNDSEVIVHLMAQSKAETFVDRAAEALKQVSGAYSLVLMTKTELLAARDPHGFRPLCLGKLDGSYIVASETCVMDLIEAEFIREVEPGELILINDQGIQSFFPFNKVETKYCVFEHIYFARPDSFMFGEHVYMARKAMGRAMAQESPAPIFSCIVPHTKTTKSGIRLTRVLTSRTNVLMPLTPTAKKTVQTCVCVCVVVRNIPQTVFTLRGSGG